MSAKVLNINPKERRIGLSIKQIEIDEEHDLVAGYLTNYKGPASRLGEVLRENLKERTARENSTEEAAEAPAEELEKPEVETEGGGREGGETEGASSTETDSGTGEALTEADEHEGVTGSGEDVTPPPDVDTDMADSAADKTVEAEVEEKETGSQDSGS